MPDVIATIENPALRRLALVECFLAKASPDDPEHPGYPAGDPDGRGGEFEPKDETEQEKERIIRELKSENIRREFFVASRAVLIAIGSLPVDAVPVASVAATRVQKLLDAFELCVKTQVIANDHFGDLETQNIAVQQYGAVVEELDAVPPGRIVLATFLDHSDDGVRVIAAAQLYFRDLMIEKVVPILKHADERSVGAVGWTAFQAFHMHPVPAKT